jgi:chemotaxis protein CheX
MKAEWINPFISNAISVFEQMTSIKFEKSNLTLKEDPKPSNDISIIIGITGFIQGQVVYSLKDHTAYRIAQSIAPKSALKIDNALIESTIAEIANIITGRTTVQLSGEDKILHITPPTVIIGKDYSINFIKLKTISVSLSSRFGTLEVNVAIKEVGDGNSQE